MQNLKYDLSLDDYYIITKHLKKTKSDLMYEDYHFYINTYCKNKKILRFLPITLINDLNKLCGDTF